MTETAVSFNANPENAPEYLTDRQTQMVCQLIGLMMLGEVGSADIIFAPEELDWLFEHGFISPLVHH